MYVIAVDVGSESARACITSFSSSSNNNNNGNQAITGQVLITRKHPIVIRNVQRDYYEQSSDEIWTAVRESVRACIEASNVDPHQILGIAFTATCSLALSGSKLPTGNDVIMWMDHRACEIATELTASNDPVLFQFGGVCSPEMSIAKIFWLRRYQPKLFSEIKHFLELPCWLTYNCIKDHGSQDDHQNFAQSTCSVTCKWGYESKSETWPAKLYSAVGKLENWKSKICQKVTRPGERVGKMSSDAMNDLGLNTVNGTQQPTIAVASSTIDAHAGVLAMITLYYNQFLKPTQEVTPLDHILSIIAGTSTCIMSLSRVAKSSRGVWGPYYDVILNDYYVREAGQSATGKLIDFIVTSHPEAVELSQRKNLNKNQVAEYLNKQILGQQGNRLGNKLCIQPAFYGNRSPLAMPGLRSCIYGQSLENVSLIDYYEAVIESLAYEVRLIVEKMELRTDGLKVLVSGGLTKNEAYMQIHADVLGCELIIMDTENADMMLAGASLLAYQGANNGRLTRDALKNIQFSDSRFTQYMPRAVFMHYHSVKYQAYKKLVDCSIEICHLLNDI